MNFFSWWINKNFRWIYADNEKDIPVLKKTKNTIAKRETIVKLNNTKNKILDSYPSIQKAAECAKISRPTMRKYIKNDTEFNNFYYVELKNCSSNLVSKYDKKINKLECKNAKKNKTNKTNK